jgi:hypothetical protein
MITLATILTALLVILIICGTAYGASVLVKMFLAPISDRMAKLANLAIGFVALIFILLYLIQLVNGGGTILIR